MVNYFIYASDSSTSTAGVKHFHRNGLKTLEQFKKDVKEIEKELLVAGEPPTESKVIYLHWDKYCWGIDEGKVREAYIDLDADFDGTKPENIIKYLKKMYVGDKNNKIKLLYIVTDGAIDKDSASKCSKLNKDMHYETVVFHVLNENLKKIDLSAATSFFKSRCVMYRNSKLFDDADISKEFDYDKVNINNFLAERNQLRSYVKLKFINKSHQDEDASEEIKKLSNLKDRLLDELSWEKLSKGYKEVYLETKNRNLFLREFVKTDWYQNLDATVYDDKIGIKKSILSLINYIVSDPKCYSFDALKFDKKFENFLRREEQNFTTLTCAEKIDFSDVTLDEDKRIPVVTLKGYDLVRKIISPDNKKYCGFRLTLASFSNLKSTMECPLFLMNDQKMSESLDSFCYLNNKQLMADDLQTRRRFQGCLVLSDTNYFDKYNDYILMATYLGGDKYKYNIGLFYYAVWKTCEKKEWMDRNVVEQFRKYTMRRISQTVCKIGLSSFPTDPQESTTLLTALWYCVELSSGIFKNDPQHFKHERLRGYYSVARYMIEILTWFNYDLDLKSIEKRRELLSYVMTLKKIQKRREKIYYLLKKIFKTVDGFLVSEIEKPFNLYKLNYLKLNHKGILRDDIVEEKVHLNDYVHLMYSEGDLEASKAGSDTFEICEKTFRPYFAIDNDKSFYTELVKNNKKVVINNDDDKDKIEVTYEAIDSLEFDRVLSLPKLFIECVRESNKYPTLREYYRYVSNRKKFHGDLVTVFPSNVFSKIKEVHEGYRKVLKEVKVEEFLQLCKSHASRTERIKAEERVKFGSDLEISEFISREELKVRLKK
uniref:p94 n=1 Tax=Cotesia sesamiae Kitale bracovirus TaxID=452648 RepID=S0DHF0_9VIRU|nr:P94 [Cotesia sesamiae Kitale bracovirus]